MTAKPVAGRTIAFIFRLLAAASLPASACQTATSETAAPGATEVPPSEPAAATAEAESSSEASQRGLQLVARHLLRNHEVQGFGLVVNEMFGGLELERL